MNPKWLPMFLLSLLPLEGRSASMELRQHKGPRVHIENDGSSSESHIGPLIPSNLKRLWTPNKGEEYHAVIQRARRCTPGRNCLERYNYQYPAVASLPGFRLNRPPMEFASSRTCYNGLLWLPCYLVEEMERSAKKTAVPHPPRPDANSYVQRFESDCGHRLAYRIINGTQVNSGDWAWTVALMESTPKGWKVFCGGTLITDYHVLTAAHCLDGGDIWRIKIRVGHTVLVWDRLPGDAEVKEVTIHPDFNREDRSADIAIIRLRDAIRLNSTVTTCCLPNFNNLVGRKGVALGWGTTATDGDAKSLSQNLKLVELPIVESSECQTKLRYNISDRVFCAGGEEGFDTCSGDSGGPLVLTQGRRWYLVGIVSAGFTPCAGKDKPGIYTRVAEFRDWIITTIG